MQERTSAAANADPKAVSQLLGQLLACIDGNLLLTLSGRSSSMSRTFSRFQSKSERILAASITLLACSSGTGTDRQRGSAASGSTESQQEAYEEQWWVATVQQAYLSTYRDLICAVDAVADGGCPGEDLLPLLSPEVPIRLPAGDCELADYVGVVQVMAFAIGEHRFVVSGGGNGRIGGTDQDFARFLRAHEAELASIRTAEEEPTDLEISDAKHLRDQWTVEIRHFVDDDDIVVGWRGPVRPGEQIFGKEILRVLAGRVSVGVS